MPLVLNQCIGCCLEAFVIRVRQIFPISHQSNILLKELGPCHESSDDLGFASNIIVSLGWQYTIIIISYRTLLYIR